MANRKQRAARRNEEQEQAPEQTTTESKETVESMPAGKPTSARKMFFLLWGIPLLIFIIIAIIKETGG